MMTSPIYQKLLACAYNIVGSHEDARDLVQEAMEKFIGVDKSRIANETGYLVKTVVNLSINFKKRQDRTCYGVWLPEPISTTDEPDRALDRKHVARYSLLVLLERLNPRERAVFILREGFGYSHDEIADLLDQQVENSRQLLARARKKLGGLKFHQAESISPRENAESEKLLEPYLTAIAASDTQALERLLVEEVHVMADGGKTARVVRDFVTGRAETARLLHYVFGQFLEGKTPRFTVVNHQPAIGFFADGKLYNCQVFSLTADGTIAAIHSIVDPAKLARLTF